MRNTILVLLLTSFASLAFAFEEPVNFSSFSADGATLYRGARPTAENLIYLKNLGVKTIIDLQGGDIKDPIFGEIAAMMEPGEWPDWIDFEKKTAKKLGMKFMNIQLNSLASVNGPDGFKVGKILKALADPANQPVYIHCEHGQDRTGMVVALFRVYFQDWSPEDAHDEMVSLGHGMISQIMTSGMDDFFWAAARDKDNH